jgi:hypothetical protein
MLDVLQNTLYELTLAEATGLGMRDKDVAEDAEVGSMALSASSNTGVTYSLLYIGCQATGSHIGCLASCAWTKGIWQHVVPAQAITEC